MVDLLLGGGRGGAGWVASLAVYLCSDAAKNLSGQCIAVTAGEPAV